jgi:hypothetical protein
MTIEPVRRLHRAQPFEPFSLRLADGRELAVDHPEFLAMSPVGRTISVAQPDGSFDIVDLLRVTSLHVGNGKKKPRKG